MYKNTEVALDTNGSLTRPITSNRGVGRACSTSPMLFSSFLDEAAPKWKLQFKYGVKIDSMNRVTFWELQLYIQ